VITCLERLFVVVFIFSTNFKTKTKKEWRFSTPCPLFWFDGVCFVEPRKASLKKMDHFRKHGEKKPHLEHGNDGVESGEEAKSVPTNRNAEQ
jgi:hypothetical protein